MLDDFDAAENRGIPDWATLRNEEPDEIPRNEGLFQWIAARNCVEFFLNGNLIHRNPRKHDDFKWFLSLPIERARETNVWRWYFETGGHPPYDPDRLY